MTKLLKCSRVLTSGEIRESGQLSQPHSSYQVTKPTAMTAAPAPTQSKGDSPVTVADERVAQAPGAPEAGTPETKQRSTLLTGISRWNAKITAKKQKKRKTSQTAVVLDAVYDDLPGLTASELRAAGFSLRDRIRPEKDGGVSRAAFVALAPTIAKWPTGDQERWTKEAVSLVAAVRSMREAGERAEVERETSLREAGVIVRRRASPTRRKPPAAPPAPAADCCSCCPGHCCPDDKGPRTTNC